VRQLLIAMLFIASSAGAATLSVNPGDKIQAAVDKANAGDTILIHAGTYRERVVVNRDGLTIVAAPGERVVLTGADVIPASAWEKLADKPIWRHTDWTYHSSIHPNDAQHHLIGRTEQVIVDGHLLKQVESLDQMAEGSFYADTDAKALYLRGPIDNVQASVRPLLLRVDGHHDVVRGLNFQYASNHAQEVALDLEGSDNLAEDCVVEWTNGAGARIAGDRNTFRRVTSRFNGQMGMSGHGTGNVMEECLLEGNNVKGYSKSWEAGGIKVTVSRGFKIIHCRAIRNDGPGIWFDIDNRNELVEESYAAENNGAGIFIEISETATVRKNICLRNGLKNEPGAWNGGGILLGEAMHCVIEANICVGNRNGIEVRQQRVRSLPADAAHDRPEEKRYYSDGHVFRRNVAAFNKEWQFAVYGDNPFFGAKKEATEEEMALFDPDQRGWQAGQNIYYAAPGEGLILWGAKWLPKHQEYSDLKKFAADHHLDATSAVEDPHFANWEAGDFTIKPLN
jgi:hypothetical protein